MSNKTKRRHKEPSVETKNLAPVQDAVREYRVIEDGAFAYHLQEEEIENHYAQNVNMRRIVQEDIRKAKKLQDEEDRRAKIMTLDEEQKVQQMDNQLAEIIQEEIFVRSVQEEQERKEWEGRDEEFALLMEETERRRVENVRSHEERDHHLAKQLQYMNVDHSINEDEHRMRLMTDEGLAKRLQEEEKLKAERDKKRKKEMKSVIEMQDEELAKHIHDRDVEAAEIKLRKEKENRNKSKKKGKLENEPLYYDDNINPPTYHETPLQVHPNDRRRGQPHSGRRHQETHPKSHEENPPRNLTPINCDAPPEYRRYEEPGRRRPERPAPPEFDESHNTEVKVPLDESQRRRNGRNLNQAALEYSRDYERGSSQLYHDDERDSCSEKNRSPMVKQHRVSSEKHRPKIERERQQGFSQPHPREVRDQRMHEPSRDGRNFQQDSRPRQESGRPMSHKEASRSKPKSSSNQSKSTVKLDGGTKKERDLQHSENFDKLGDEGIQKQNGKVSYKGGSQKKKGGDCKQQ